MSKESLTKPIDGKRPFDSPLLLGIEKSIHDNPSLTLVRSLPYPAKPNQKIINSNGELALNGVIIYAATTKPTFQKTELDSCFSSFLQMTGKNWNTRDTVGTTTFWFPHVYLDEIVGKQITTRIEKFYAIPGTQQLLKREGINIAETPSTSIEQDITRRIDLYLYPLLEYAELLVGIREGRYIYDGNIWDRMYGIREDHLQLLSDDSNGIKKFAQLFKIQGLDLYGS